MGYYATLFEGDLVIKSEKIEAAQTALGVDDLTKLLIDNGFDATCYDTEGLVVEAFDSKWRSETNSLLLSLAPFVNETLLGFRGEDGDLWCFEYADGEVTEKAGQVVWI